MICATRAAIDRVDVPAFRREPVRLGAAGDLLERRGVGGPGRLPGLDLPARPGVGIDEELGRSKRVGGSPRCGLDAGRGRGGAASRACDRGEDSERSHRSRHTGACATPTLDRHASRLASRGYGWLTPLDHPGSGGGRIYPAPAPRLVGPVTDPPPDSAWFVRAHGAMLWLRWKRFSGSQARLSSRSRSYFDGPPNAASLRASVTSPPMALT